MTAEAGAFVQRMVVIPEDVWEELQARCYARGRTDFRNCAGGFIQDALEGGFLPETDEEWARYEAFKVGEARITP